MQFLSHIELTILDWFQEFRPDIYPLTGDDLQQIEKQMKNEFGCSDLTTKRFLFNSFFAEYYPTEIGDLVSDTLEEMAYYQDGNEPYDAIIQDWVHIGCYHAEKGGIMKLLYEKNIPEKYLVVNNYEIFYSDEMKTEIRKIIIDRIEKYWLHNEKE